LAQLGTSYLAATSDPQLPSYRCRFRYAFMGALTVGKMTDPTTEKSEVQRLDSKLPQQKRPKVNHDRGPDKKSSHNEF
jgi:hypothetical protein